MRKTKIILFLAVMAIFTGFKSIDVVAQSGVSRILREIDRVESYKSNYIEMKQIITTSSGSKRTLVIRGWAINNGDKQLSEYLAPSDIKGQKILMTNDGDNIWMYNPETRRTRKLGSHMKKRKVMGSDFTYEDQNMGNISKKYRGSVLKSENFGGTNCYVLQLTPTPKGPSYSKIILWVGKNDYVARKIDFYEKNSSRPFKRLIMKDVRKVGKKDIPFQMTMTNLEDRTETINIITRIQFDVNIPMSIFNSSSLGR